MEDLRICMKYALYILTQMYSYSMNLVYTDEK